MSQQSDLAGWGTALTGAEVDKNGQTFGGGKNINSYLAQLQKYDPNASMVDDTNSEGTYAGSHLNFDPSKLPTGFMQSATGSNGGIELDDPNSRWGDGSGTKIINPGLIQNDDNYGRHTGQTNIFGVKDPFMDTYAPLIVAAVAGGAGAGLLGGFGGMTDAAAQGLVSGATGSMAGSAAGAADALGTGAFDMGGSSGSGIPGSEGLGTAGQGSSFMDSIGQKLNPQNWMSNIQHDVSDPSWWMKQAAKQGMSYEQRKATADALRARQQQMMGG